MATSFRIFTFGALVPVTWPLSSRWYPIIQRLLARIRSAFRTCWTFLTSQSRWNVALASTARQLLALSAPFIRKLAEDIRGRARDHLIALGSLLVETVPASERSDHRPHAEHQHHH